MHFTLIEWALGRMRTLRPERQLLCHIRHSVIEFNYHHSLHINSRIRSPLHSHHVRLPQLHCSILQAASETEYILLFKMGKYFFLICLDISECTPRRIKIVAKISRRHDIVLRTATVEQSERVTARIRIQPDDLNLKIKYKYGI